jgi:hypothetical protein
MRKRYSESHLEESDNLCHTTDSLASSTRTHHGVPISLSYYSAQVSQICPSYHTSIDFVDQIIPPQRLCLRVMSEIWAPVSSLCRFCSFASNLVFSFFKAQLRLPSTPPHVIWVYGAWLNSYTPLCGNYPLLSPLITVEFSSKNLEMRELVTKTSKTKAYQMYHYQRCRHRAYFRQARVLGKHFP